MSVELERIQQWMQAVITHPQGIAAGIDSPDARQSIDVAAADIERVISRSQALDSVQRLAVYGNAYYAVFHLLAHEGATLLAAGTRVVALRGMLIRGFGHEEMKAVSQSVARRQWPARIAVHVGAEPIPNELAMVAQRFVELQGKRHSADYDVTLRYSRGEVAALLDQADEVFETWSTIRKEPAARIFLAALFAGRKIKA